MLKSQKILNNKNKITLRINKKVMFNYEHNITGNIDIEKLWDLHSNTKRRIEWENDLLSIDLNDAFETGTTGVMHMKDMPPMPFILDEVIKYKKAVDTTTLGNLSIQFSHIIKKEKNGEYTITHSISIKSTENEPLEEIGSGIVADVPESM